MTQVKASLSEFEYRISLAEQNSMSVITVTKSLGEAQVTIELLIIENNANNNFSMLNNYRFLALFTIRENI